jgi:hypothetical protein
MRARIALLTLAAATVAGAAPAHAGIVNVQSVLATEAEEGLSGSITAGVDWRTGTIRLLGLSAAPVARYRAGDHLLIGIVRGEYRTFGDSKVVARTFEHLRYRYRLVPRVTAEVFAQHEYDEFRRIELRALAGAGPKFDLVHRPRTNLAWGLAYMLEHRRLRDDDQPDAGARRTQHRASSYLTGSYQVKDDLQLVETFYAQPVLTDPGDIRLLSESQLVVKLTDQLALTTSFVLAYDRRPPAGVKRLDTALTHTVGYSF